jgi:hypothetical protein
VNAVTVRTSLPLAPDKRTATLIAVLAISGHAVHRKADGGFVVSRWNMARHCGDLDSLEAFAAQVGAITGAPA